MGNKIVLAVTVVALASVGCGQEPQHGKLQIRATAAALTGTQAGVVSMTFQLLGDGNGWSGVQGDLYNEKLDGTGHWSYTADLIPIGGVKLNAQARDVHGTVIFQTAADVHMDIVAHQVVAVTLLLQDVRPQTIFDDTAPYITSLTSTASQIDALTPITLEAKVTHPTGGAMTYAWTSSAGGTLSAPAGLVTTWLPPGNGDCTLTFSATNEFGSMAALSVTIKVQSSFAKGGLAVLMDFNAWPVVSKVSTDGAEAKAGVAMTVVALATDADDNQLTYSWAADCDPTFTASTPTIAFTPLAAGPCVLTVTVLDGHGGSNKGILRFTVGAAAAAIGPQFYVRFVSPSEIYPGQKAEMQVMPLSTISEAGWTYRWDYGIGPNRGLDGFTDGSDVWFTPPTCTAAMIATGVVTITVSVLITDTATGAYNSATMPIMLHCN